MKVLLDTHAFIWWDSAPEKLSPPARAGLSGPNESAAPQRGQCLGDANQAATGQAPPASPASRGGCQSAANQLPPGVACRSQSCLRLAGLASASQGPL